MTRTMASHDAHLADDELLRFIDGEQDERQKAWAAHVASCGHCAGEVALLRGDAQVVRQWLERAAFEEALPARDAHSRPAPAPPHPRSVAHVPPRAAAPGPHRAKRRWSASSPWLRAAVFVLLATPVAALPPVRAWIVGTIAEIGGGPEPAPATLQIEAPVPAAAAAIRFVPAAGAFAVTLESAQAGGVLTLRRGTGEEAVLQLGGADAEPVVSETSLRIRNQAASTVSYLLDVPPGVSRVTVQVGGGRPVLVGPAELAAGVSLDLRR